MNNLELYKKLNFPNEVIEKLTEYGQNRIGDLPILENSNEKVTHI